LGINWANFLQSLSYERIKASEDSLLENLGGINAKSFLDAGSGSDYLASRPQIWVQRFTLSTLIQILLSVHKYLKISII